MSNLNSNLITNPATFVPVLNPTGKDYGRVRIAQDNFEVAVADLDATDTLTLVRLPAIARLLSFRFTNDDIGAATMSLDFGIYDVDGTAKDDDAFGGLNVGAANRLIELLDQANTAAQKAAIGDALWVWAGDATQPERGTEYDIVAHVQVSSVPVAGTVGFQIMWAID